MLTNLVGSLHKLEGTSVAVSAVDTYKEPGTATVQLLFNDASRLRAAYWRLIRDGKERVSSFDHEQKYGLQSQINAIHVLQNELRAKTVTLAQLDKETGDLLFQFTGNLKLQVFGFTGYEIWEIRISGAGGEYSNHAKEVCRIVPDDFGSSGKPKIGISEIAGLVPQP